MVTANVQFITIVVGTFAGIFLNNRAFERLEDPINARFAAMGGRFNALDARIDRIFGELGTFHSIQGRAQI